MAIWQSISGRRAAESRKRRKAKTNRVSHKDRRSLGLEPFEERLLLAIDGPQLLAAIPSTGTVINDNTVLQQAPRQILLRFSAAIDTDTLSNSSIQFVRSVDDVFGNSNDIVVTPGFIGVENPNRPNEVVVRFNENLPDDNYRMIIVGAGSSALKDQGGKAFQDGTNLTRPFSLDLAPQVVAVVPQPITRNAGVLTQAVNQIDVYFNVNDPLSMASAQNVANYQLIRTGGTNGTATPNDDARFNPISVTYDSTTGKAILTFDTGVLTTVGTYRLRVGNSEPLAQSFTTLTPGNAGDNFAQAASLGNPFSASLGMRTVAINDSITSIPVAPGLIWPGSPLEPGEREFNSDTAHVSGFSNNGDIPLISYNFKGQYGVFQGQPQINLITEAQKERIREVFEYYSYYLGVQFVETADAGWTIAVGDPRFLGATPNVGGVAGGGIAIMNSSVNWGASETRGAFFNTSMHEIGHLLGLLHNYEAPAVMGGGIQDGVYPGDLDLIYGKFLWPTLGNDVNLYNFSLPAAGKLSLETIAERMQTLGVASSASRFDSVITLYDATGTIIARNDDYYGKDSFLQLDLAAGTYYVAITSTGNTNFDPRVSKSGAGGTTMGNFQLRMSFTPTPNSAQGITDTSGNRLDGDNDGVAGGVNNFWFKVANTIYVDKAATAGTGALGSITNPHTRIGDALAAAPQGSIVRIVSNGGADGNVLTTGDNLSYNIGFDSIGGTLSDGAKFEVPRGVTVMVDAGTILKLRGTNINVGSVDAGSINRSQGALQILGTPTNSVYVTSYFNNNNENKIDGIGAPMPNSQGLAKGNWGGIVFRDDSDLEANGVFLNTVNQAKISYGGGAVTVDGELAVYRPIHMETARPTITFNTIQSSADAAMSATPNSFEESEFQGAAFLADYTRVGPKIYGNRLSDNSVNGLFVAIETSSQTGRVLDELTVSGRIANTDIVHVLTETLVVNGQPGGPTGSAANLIARPSGRLSIDPGTVFKLAGGRFETELGGTLIAEGTIDRPIIFTSLYDDRFGRGGSSDTSNNSSTPDTVLAAPGDWGGFIFGPTSQASLDYTLVAYAGGDVRFEGFLSGMDPVEIHQAKVRIANSTFQVNRLPGGNDRNGRGSSDPTVIYIRGAQPVILNNVFEGNIGGSVISANVNSLNSALIDDWGRSQGPIGLAGSYPKNFGPLIRNNLVGDNSINGMVVRGGLLTTNSVWDDTDIVHVVTSSMVTSNQQSLTGTLRLQSSATESLVVKMLGTNVDLIAGGEQLDIDDRTGGTLQIVGMPGRPVVITSLKDDTVGAGLTPQGLPQRDTRNTKGVVPDAPPNSETTGPVMLDTTPRDVHGSDFPGLDGWDSLYKEILYVYNNSRVTTNSNRILYIGLDTDDELGTPYSLEAINWVIQNRMTGVTLEIAETGSEIASALANADNYAMIYIPSHSAYPLPQGRAQRYQNTKWWGGVADFQLQTINNNKSLLLDYVNNQGGGLLVMAQDSADLGYNFVAAADPYVLRKSGGNVMTATEVIADGFNAIDYTDVWLNIGTPYRSVFEGSSGFNRMVPWAVDPVTGEIAMLGRAAGGPALGAPRDVARPGDWGSIRLDVLSNDTNVEIINEVEQGFTAQGDTNQTPNTAQAIGELAKDNLSGNDNVRLGFEIYGGLSQATNSAGGADVDVYSFRGTAGTTVWLDIDRTSASLDSVIELVDANGAVIARSDNSLAESGNPSLLVGIGKRMQPGTNAVSNYALPDFYSSNEKDAGMRVVLPGTNGNVNTYYVRVRSSSSNLNTLTAGVTKGSYMLQIRLQEKDQFAGSTVRYADVRYANNGIEVIGKPEQSALVTNTAQNSLASSSFFTAQDLGNLLESGNKTIDVAGNLTSADSVHWYKFSLNYEQIQSIAGLNDGLRTFAAMMQVNFADGLGRPDTTLSLYDEQGTLIMISRDGEIADSLPRPNVGGIGSDTGNLAHGSYGTLDPTLGPVHLPAGAPKTYLPGGAVNPSSVITYYVAISSNASLPEALTASFGANSSNPLIRLEPVDSTRRIIDDRVGFGGGGITTAAGGTAPEQNASRLFDGSLSAMNNYADSYHLGDVVLFANRIENGQQRLVTINPFTGRVMTTGNVGLDSDPLNQQIAMRNDGQLMALTYGTDEGSGGNYLRVNTATGTTTFVGDDGAKLSIATSTTQNADGTWPVQLATGETLEYTAMTFLQSPNSADRRLFAIAQRSDNPSNGSALNKNILVELNPDTGAVLNTTETVHDVDGGSIRSGTNFVPLGILTVGGQNISADQMQGMAIVNNQMYTITADGRLYRLNNSWSDAPSQDDANIDTGYGVKQIPVGGRTITSLIAGPLHAENGAYSSTLFAMDTEGRMYAFDTNGNMRGVFLNGASTIDTGLSSVEGMSFSTFDYNLWHVTTDRAFDPGHGINPAYNGNYDRTTAGTDNELLIGGASYYFGLSGVPTNQQPEPAQIGARAYSTNANLENTYAVPGGTYGTLTSDAFSLEGYSSFDKPTLYFNYLLDTPDVNSLTATTDAFRVFASTDGANWELLATNNVLPGNDNAEHAEVLTPSGGAYNGTGAKQKTQGLYDSTMVNGQIVWRQARVDLGDYAGKAGIKLRFEFTTAGTMGSNNNLVGYGRSLAALPGSKLSNGQTFSVDNTTFTFIKGGVSNNPTTDIVILEGDTAAEVARKMAAALDRAFTVGPAIDDPNIFTSAKVVGEELRLFAHAVTDQGPLAYFDGTLTGDNNGRFDLRTRDRSEVYYEGIYIDDFVVGFASRGEMVTGAAPGSTLFAAVPPANDDVNQILTGAYQLQIRPAQEFGAVNDDGDFFLLDTFDVNDRFAQQITIEALPAALISDGQSFVIDDGTQELRFEFDLNGTIANSSRVRIAISSGMTAAEVALQIESAINGAVTNRGFKVRAKAHNNGAKVDLFDALDVAPLSNQGLAEIYFFDSVGDQRPLAGASAPGQTIIQNTSVNHSRQVGIQVVPKMNQIEETGIAFTVLGQIPIGVPGNTGGIALLPTANTRGWVPGVTIKNNLVTNSGRTGIQIGGDPNASYAYAQGGDDEASGFRDVELFLPFVRVVNNTIYNAKIGIAATNASSPTIINNIIANAQIQTGNVIRFAGGGIYVDGSSGAPKGLPAGVQSKFGDTIVSANVYQNNSNNLLGTSETLGIALAPGDPLFVDAINGNFYLNAQSKAIDSSIDTLLDRAELLNVIAPLGIAPSPIIAPARDIFGQLRVDDPAVSPPAGVGGNAFKDRGALERGDFIGPTAQLINPVDNNAADRNLASNQVRLLNGLLTDFSIQLLDSGVGIDPTSVTNANFVVTRTVGGVTTTLTPGLDYVLSFDTNASIVRLIPTQGIWINGIYNVTLANVNNGTAAIRDLAGNRLQENAPPATKFVIELTDTIVSPWQNPTNRFDVNNDTRVNGSDLLLLINRLLLGQGGELPAVAQAPPYLDPTGDGRLNTSDVLAVINQILAAQAQSAAPLAAISSDGEAPQVEPLVASTTTESGAVASGIVFGSQTEAEVAAPVATPAVAASAESAKTRVQTVDRVMGDVMPQEVDPLAEASEWDADLESILGDLGSELSGRAAV